MPKSRALFGAISVALALAVILVAIGHVSLSDKGLRAEVVMTKADIGIPGISRMYETRLVNRGLWPARVSYCAFVDDSMSPGKKIGYRVERWDKLGQKWTTIVNAHGRDFCKPYPLGIVRANLMSALLWPGQSLSTGDEATAARDGFNVGDKARFVVFTGDAEDSKSFVASPEFVIDEHPLTDSQVRVKH
jgi:hypothetical protein